MIKTLNERLSGMEKRAFVFLRVWLEVILAASLVTVSAAILGKGGGLREALFVLTLREIVTYLVLTLLLSVGGGLFIDYAIKTESNK